MIQVTTVALNGLTDGNKLSFQVIEIGMGLGFPAYENLHYASKRQQSGETHHDDAQDFGPHWKP